MDWEGILDFGRFVFVVLVIVGVVFLSISAFTRYQCHNYGTNTNHQVKYNFWSTACYVKTLNGWFTPDQINQNTVNVKNN